MGGGNARTHPPSLFPLQSSFPRLPARSPAVSLRSDTAQVALGRLILLDSALIFATALALYGLARFRALHDRCAVRTAANRPIPELTC